MFNQLENTKMKPKDEIGDNEYTQRKQISNEWRLIRRYSNKKNQKIEGTSKQKYNLFLLQFDHTQNTVTIIV